MDTLIKTTDLDTLASSQGVVVDVAHNGIFGGGYNYNFQDPTSIDETASVNFSVEVTVDYSGEVDRPTETKSVMVIEGETARTATQNVFYIEDQDTRRGKFITGINGVKPSEGKFWLFKINGDVANVGPSSYKLQAGDKLKYEVTSQYPLFKQQKGGTAHAQS